MSTLLVAAVSLGALLLAYFTYGRWLAGSVFQLDANAEVPSKQLQDDVDYCPTDREVVFGHHFTSIAGTGPIVGPAIAVFWGWLPALLWVVLGSIFIGAVHDFGSLMVSLRSRGQTIGEVAGRMINPRARILFLIVLFLALTIVLAVFGLVIALIFDMYPQSVLSVWIAMPLAVAIGFWAYRMQGSLLWPSILGTILLYAAVWVGVYWLPVTLPNFESPWLSPVVLWTLILFVYCFFASVLPVWVLLQPRDYINSHQLKVAMGLLVLGLVVAGLTGQANLFTSTEAVSSTVPADAPMIFPFLFITIACGACSGFHCLVASGTSSKQLENEEDAQYVGYGGMLLEGALAVVVILACCAGVGMGKFEPSDNTVAWVAKTDGEGKAIEGAAAWREHYRPLAASEGNPSGGWKGLKLGDKVGAFIEGGANFISALGVPIELGIGIVAVLVACFAATTIDTATRLQRYVVQELGGSLGVAPLKDPYVATTLALGVALSIALFTGSAPGAGGMTLWPLFGATNQLLAGLAFMVIVFYLWRRQRVVLFAAAPMLFMLLMPLIAMLIEMFHPSTGWLAKGNWPLLVFGAGVIGLQVWMMAEAALLFPRVQGILEEELPPLEAKAG